MRQAESRHNEELQHIVERRTVAHVGLDDRAYASHVAESRRREHTLAGFHPRTVAADGVYLTVVRQQAERLGKAPRRERVGAEARMHHRQTACEIRLCEIGEIFAHLHRRQHALINYVLARKRHDVEILMLDASLYAFSYDVQFAVDVCGISHTGYEHLLYVRLGSKGVLAQYRRIDGHVAEMHQVETLTLNLLYHYAEHASLLLLVLWKEHQTRTVFALLRYRNALQEDELVWYLKHYSGSVAGLVIGALGSTMLHVFEHFESRIHQFVRFVAVDVHNHAHSTCIMFV